MNDSVPTQDMRDWDPLRPSRVRAYLREHEFLPRKTLGQNFLIDRNVQALILSAAALEKHDVVVEIGPGLGALTDGLVRRAGHVLAIEKDVRLAAFLQRQFAGIRGLTVIEGDALAVDIPERVRLIGGEAGWKLVSNLPYASGTRILVELLHGGDRPATMTVTLQREVADRLSARPGTKVYGLLSVWAQRLYAISIVHVVKPGCFYPAPEVSSAIVKLTGRDGVDNDEGKAVRFQRATRRAFEHRRKQLATTLPGTPGLSGITPAAVKAGLEGMGLPGTARPENLDSGEWWALLEGLGAAS